MDDFEAENRLARLFVNFALFVLLATDHRSDDANAFLAFPDMVTPPGS